MMTLYEGSIGSAIKVCSLKLFSDAVMYMNLEGGGGGEACPSIADSSAVSLSQMAFLSMTVSVFSVVARFNIYLTIRPLIKK